MGLAFLYLGYNLEQNKMEQQSPNNPKYGMKPPEGYNALFSSWFRGREWVEIFPYFQSDIASIL